MDSSKRTIERLSASASEILSKTRTTTANKEHGNIIENASLLNNTKDEETIEYEWNIDNIITKQQNKDAKLSQDIILALIATFVIVASLAVSYIFIFDYYSVEDINQQKTNIDSLKFTYIETEVTLKDIRQLYNDFNHALDSTSSTKSLIATSVRLVFSDCAGPLVYKNGSMDNTISICDGCIDIDLSNNIGLHENAIQPLEKLYYDGAYDKIMSRADYWSAIATIALNIAAKSKYKNQMHSLENFIDQIDSKPDNSNVNSDDNKGNNLQLLQVNIDTLNLPFYFGRIDCYSTPFSHNDLKIYPSENYGFKDTYNWFKNNFGFNEMETVVILGAHTLINKPYMFDNEYYKWMLDKTEKWHFQSSHKNYINQNGNISMFNSDLSLVYNIDGYLDTSSGIIDAMKCDVENGNCDTQQITYDVVQKYAIDNQQFYNDFARVWDKMVTIGYSKNMLTKFSLVIE